MPISPLLYRKNPQTAGRILDGLAFVVTADDNKMHTLNASASVLWSLAATGVTVEQGATALVQQFEVELPVAMSDVAECLASLVARGILVAG